MNIDDAKDEVLAACRELVQEKLVSRTWGNVSFRIDDRRMAITPSGIGYDRLTRREIVAVDLRTLGFEGGVKPSSEKGIHALAYLKYPAVNCVIHTHQRCATILGAAGFDTLSPFSAEECAALGGQPRLAAYALPGTKNLVRNAGAVLTDGATLLARHGALLCGKDRAEAFARAATLEAACLKRLPLAAETGEDAATVFSARAGDGGFVFSSGGVARSWGSAENAGEWPVSLHQAIYRQYPGFSHIRQWTSPAVLRFLSGQPVPPAVPAMIDDFAQMAGIDTKIVETGPAAGQAEIRRALQLLRGRNCLGVTGLGFLCCAGNDADCSALLSLLQKNTLVFLHGRGTAKPLPMIDRLLMRAVYQLKYSKKR